MVLVHGLVDPHDADGARLVAVLVDLIDADRKQDRSHGSVAGVRIVHVETGDEMIADSLRQIGRDLEVRAPRRRERDSLGDGARFAVRRFQHIVAFRKLAGRKGQQQLMIVDEGYRACGRLFGGIDGDDCGVRREAEAFHDKCQRLSGLDVLDAGRDGYDFKPNLFGGQRVADRAAVLRIQHHINIPVIALRSQRQLCVVDAAHGGVVALARRGIPIADVEFHPAIIFTQSVQRQLVGFPCPGGELVGGALAGTDGPFPVGQSVRGHGDGDGFHVALRCAGRLLVVDVGADQQVVAAVDHT